MLTLIASGATQLAGAGVSELGKLASNWFGGAATDATRKQRADWMLGAARLGSILAAQIIYAAPDNVASNEDPYWRDAAISLQQGDATARATWVAAVQRGKYWPVGAPFSMPDQVAAIQQELAALGRQASGSIQTGSSGASSGSTSSVQQGLGDLVQGAGSQLVNSAANAINPAGNYQTIPTKTNTLVMLAVGAVVVLALVTHRRS